MIFKFSYTLLLTTVLTGTWYTTFTNQANASELSKKQALGWMWYQDPPRQIKPVKKKQDKQDVSKEASSSESAPSPYIYSQQAKKYREELDNLEAKAVLYPTMENVLAFQKAHNLTMNKAEDFQKIWMLVSLLSGEGYREGGNAAPHALKIEKELQDQKLEQQIHELAKTFGLFFIYKNDCPYCHKMAPLVKQLQDTYQFQVKAISPDAIPLPEFPDAEQDNGALAQIQFEGVFPMVYLVNPNTGQFTPLARGLNNLSELKQNFRTIINYLNGETHAN